MSTILSLLAFFAGATVVIAIGTRISLSIYQQTLIEVDSLKARRVQPSPSEVQVLLERSGTVDMVDLIGTGTRYAWIALGVVALIILLVILVIVGLFSGVVL